MKRRINLVNKAKLVRWDADWYKELTDADCIVCLTERQVYLIHEMLEALTWVNTRWVGDTADLDFDLIKSNLQFALDERMTCEQLTILVQQIESLTAQVTLIQNQSFSEGNTIVVGTTVLDDIFSTAAQAATEFFETAACTDADKDAVYGACNALIRHIHQNNVDFLESLSQAGNVTDQSKRLLSGIPLVGLLPLDEIADYATFIIDELLEEYNATVTEELLQIVICDLFCIAIAADCALDFADLLNYFAAKVDPSLSNATTTFLSLVQFAIAGTFAGNDYFYYLCYFQLWLAYADSEFFGNIGIQTLAMTARSGFNSPDNDWSIFCIDCPEPVGSHPEIGLADCSGFAPAMGVLTWLHGTTWQLESQVNGSTDNRAMVVRTGGGKFRMPSVVATVGSIPPFRVWKPFGSTCQSGFGAPNPADVDMLMYGFTSAIGSPFTLEISFVDID